MDSSKTIEHAHSENARLRAKIVDGYWTPTREDFLVAVSTFGAFTNALQMDLAALQQPAAEPVAWKPTHRHVKRGTVYRLIADAVLQSEAPVSDDAYLALYQGEDGKYWVRPADEFKDGRFEPMLAKAEPGAPQ